MAIPDYQTLMLPVLRMLGDGEVRRVVPDITDPLGEQFHLTTEERQQMLPSGMQATFVNRTHWAVTYMGKAGLLARPTRARVQITNLGLEALGKKPAKIDIAFLMDYPGFEAFRTKAKPKAQNLVVGDALSPRTLLDATAEGARAGATVALGR